MTGEAAAPGGSAAGVRAWWRGVRFDQQLIVFLLFVAIFVVFAVSLTGFFSVANLLTLMRTVSVLGILGLGMAVVVISSYLPEVMLLSDRLLVARQGKVVEEFSALEATEEKLMYAAVH